MSNIPCEFCSWDPTLSVSAEYTLLVGQSTVSQNSLKSNTGGNRWRYKRVRNAFLADIKPHPVSTAAAKRRVIFTRYYGLRQREYDSDNLVGGLKPLRDCLKMLGWVVDDSPKWIEAHYRQVKSTSTMAYINILIQDIEWPTIPPKKKTKRTPT